MLTFFFLKNPYIEESNKMFKKIVKQDNNMWHVGAKLVNSHFYKDCRKSRKCWKPAFFPFPKLCNNNCVTASQLPYIFKMLPLLQFYCWIKS